MGYGVLGGTVLQCSFGMAPSVLNVLPTARVISSMPMASIADCVPLVNIMPFGMCSSMANPTVAAATAAAMGALTPHAMYSAYCRNMDAWFSYCIGRRKASFESKLQTDLCLWRHH